MEDEKIPVEPKGGAGLYDVDPPQDKITQDPEIIPQATADSQPEEVEF